MAFTCGRKRRDLTVVEAAPRNPACRPNRWTMAAQRASAITSTPSVCSCRVYSPISRPSESPDPRISTRAYAHQIGRASHLAADAAGHVALTVRKVLEHHRGELVPPPCPELQACGEPRTILERDPLVLDDGMTASPAATSVAYRIGPAAGAATGCKAPARGGRGTQQQVSARERVIDTSVDRD